MDKEKTHHEIIAEIEELEQARDKELRDAQRSYEENIDRIKKKYAQTIQKKTNVLQRQRADSDEQKIKHQKISHEISTYLNEKQISSSSQDQEN